jgi:hypothetical protein
MRTDRISEGGIERLVDGFYVKVRADPEHRFGERWCRIGFAGLRQGERTSGDDVTWNLGDGRNFAHPTMAKGLGVLLAGVQAMTEATCAQAAL